MQNFKKLNHSLKKILFLFFAIATYYTGYAQLNVSYVIPPETNQLNSQYNFAPTENVSRDLFFSISPNGIPQYGQTPSWNLKPNSSGTARYFHTRKGVWDRSAISTFEENISFLSNIETQPYLSTPNINMNNDWVKIDKSWNFSFDNYAIAIVSFTNRSNKTISGKLDFSHPNRTSISVPEIFIYQNWVMLVDEFTTEQQKYYSFEYRDLEPGEIRHIYIKVDISDRSSFDLPKTTFIANMVGYQAAEISDSGTIPPHDPNRLTLVTAFQNTPPNSEDCEIYNNHEELRIACENGDPFWVQCPEGGGSKCPLKQSLDYPYCNNDSELLTYRISCLNDGRGVAKDIGMKNAFSPENNPFEINSFDFLNTDFPVGSFNYPFANFFFEDINLPGLDDDNFVYTYGECSTQATFELRTQCDLNIPISAQALISFYDTDGMLADSLRTNTVNIVPEQGVYTNYEPTCDGCSHGIGNQSRPGKKIFKTQSYNNTIEVSVEFDGNSDNAVIQILDISGRLIEQKTIYAQGQSSVQKQLDITNLSSGIYLVSITSGKINHVEKFIHH